MKRIVAVILVVILAFTLVACKSSSPGTSASPGASAAASTGTAASPSPSPSPSETPKTTPAASPSPAASQKSTVGYLTDQADHFKRKPFKIAAMYISTAASFLQNINDALTTLGKYLNYDVFVYDAQNNTDGFINQVTTLADQGYTGFLVGSDAGTMARLIEVCKEAKCTYAGLLTPLVNKDGTIAMGSISMDDVNSGTTMMQWLVDNYKHYWKDPVDPAKVGCLVLDYSVVSGIHDREKNISGVFSKAFPQSAKNYIVGDLVTIENGFSAEGGQKMTAAIMSSHAEISKWFVIGLVDDWSVGAARAAESLKKQDSTLIVSHQSDAFTKEMQSGNTNSCYVAANAISPNEIAAASAAYLITILEGRATPETIWPEYVTAGNKYPNFVVKGTMVTKDTYQKWIKDTSIETLTAGLKQGK